MRGCGVCGFDMGNKRMTALVFPVDVKRAFKYGEFISLLPVPPYALRGYAEKKAVGLAILFIAVCGFK